MRKHKSKQHGNGKMGRKPKLEKKSRAQINRDHWAKRKASRPPKPKPATVKSEGPTRSSTPVKTKRMPFDKVEPSDVITIPFDGELKKVGVLDALSEASRPEFWEEVLEDGWDALWVWRYMNMRFHNAENKAILEKNRVMPFGPYLAWAVVR